MSVKNSGHNGARGEVVRAGLLKKLKTNRKKWFVLRAETSESSARLEYYDTEKKFKNGDTPKRSIPLKTCFNINKRTDTKYKHVIALYTKDDCFCIILDTEDEQEAWLKDLLQLLHGEETPAGEQPRRWFEHVWQVAILNRGLGTGITGTYRLCLTDKTLSLIKKDDTATTIDLKLSNIRTCGKCQNFFCLEIGRSSQLGAGELWMLSEDANIAQNMLTTICNAMKGNRKELPEDLTPKCRNRSSSATEASKPNTFHRKQILSGLPKAHVFSQGSLSGRERCDSMPSRPRTTSETTHAIPMWKHLTPHRSHGRDISHSPPSGSPVSPPSVGCSTDSTGSSYSLADDQDICMECSDAGLRYSGPMTPDEAIAEEDCPEGTCALYTTDYVPMGGPQSSDDGCYMDMSPRCRFHHHSTHSPTVSMSSVTSGTPSTDMRFSDYPLDKVSSYFPAEDDDTRPARAYSVGSRPEACRNKRHVELPGTPEDSRARAFSVGSKTKKIPCRVLPPHHHGIKSSSAPILSNSRSHSSHSSLGPMDDLMEMDFSRSNTGSSTNSEYANMHANNNKTTPSGYVEMKPGVEIKRKVSATPSEVSPYVDMSGGAYMDMSGTSPSKQSMLSPQPEEYSSFVDINRQYRIMSSDQPLNNNYLDMEHRTRTVSNSSGSHTYGEDYLDMSGSQSRLSQQSSTSISMSISPNKTDYMPLSFLQQDSSRINGNVSKTPEGYVEMTLGNKKNQRQPSIDAGNPNEESTTGGAKKKSSVNTKKTVSQPITITQTTSSSQVTKNSSSPLSISSLLGRKSSTNTPPKMHLPLSSWSTSSYSSLPRQRNRKDSQNSKDTSSSSSVTTPSSSSTIFPLSLNSPSSPMRPLTKTETPSSLKFSAAIFNTIYKGSNKMSSTSAKPATNDGYTMMDFEKTKPKPVDTSEYVNYAPAATTTVTPVSIVTPATVVTQAPIVTPEADDYALMEPDICETAKVTTCPVRSLTSDGVTSPLITHLSSIGIQENQSMLFRPIKEDSKMGSSPTMDMLSRKSECLRQCSSSSSSTESPYETLRAGECVSPAAKISRPNSVSSDTVKTSSPRICDKIRPASVSSDTRGAISRPSSTSSELWSSSSTLVGSRPESVNSDAIHSDSMSSQSSVVVGGASETKIHYASLDLAQSQDDEISRSPTTIKNQGDGSAQAHQEPPSIYAKIDFVVSEGLRQNNQSLPNNAKVKH